MASDYAAIREANKVEYGNIGRWGRDVLVNRYDSGAHFIFEILQNAEDALKRRNSLERLARGSVRTDSDEPADCTLRQSVHAQGCEGRVRCRRDNQGPDGHRSVRHWFQIGLLDH